jgi:hypothetical protein
VTSKEDFTPTVYEAKSWKLCMTVSWELKDGVEGKLSCDRCKGRGHWYQEAKGGFGAFDDEPDKFISCPDCDGKGTWRNPEVEDRPRVPNDLKQLMLDSGSKFLDSRRGKTRRFLTKE